LVPGPVYLGVKLQGVKLTTHLNLVPKVIIAVLTN
jgi:hypothetical protein